jgi:hypothetical protein
MSTDKIFWTSNKPAKWTSCISIHIVRAAEGRRIFSLHLPRYIDSSLPIRSKLLMFRKNLLPPSSGSKSKPSKQQDDILLDSADIFYRNVGKTSMRIDGVTPQNIAAIFLSAFI